MCRLTACLTICSLLTSFCIKFDLWMETAKGKQLIFRNGHLHCVVVSIPGYRSAGLGLIPSLSRWWSILGCWIKSYLLKVNYYNLLSHWPCVPGFFWPTTGSRTMCSLPCAHKFTFTCESWRVVCTLEVSIYPCVMADQHLFHSWSWHNT